MVNLKKTAKDLGYTPRQLHRQLANSTTLEQIPKEVEKRDMRQLNSQVEEYFSEKSRIIFPAESARQY